MNEWKEGCVNSKRMDGQMIAIYHECEGGIENSILRITVCCHKACRVMTNGDTDGRFLQSYPNTKMN